MAKWGLRSHLVSNDLCEASHSAEVSLHILLYAGFHILNRKVMGKSHLSILDLIVLNKIVKEMIMSETSNRIGKIIILFKQ